MPEMSGKDLAGEISRMRQGIKILFMSGYVADTMLGEEIYKKGNGILQKPFTRSTLAKKVKEALQS